MSVLNNSVIGQLMGDAAGYSISRSLRFNSSDSAYCLRTPSSNGTSYTTWTWSTWVKRSLASSGQVLFSSGTNTDDYLIVNFDPNDTLRFLTGENGATNQNFINTTAVFRDYSAWYHFVIQADFTNATQADRIKIYVNNVRQTVSGTIAAQNYLGTTFNRSGIAHNIGRQGNGVAYLSGYLADIHFIDGQALTPSSFTEVSATTGQLIPKTYSGSYGTNGFQLKFADNSAATATTLGKDTSGLGNNWTPNNLSVTAGAGNDSLVDVPTNGAQTDTGVGAEVRGNYCTLNPLKNPGGSTSFANGNLETTFALSGTFPVPMGTIGVSSGKWYWEITPTSGASGSGGVGVGIGNSQCGPTNAGAFGVTANGWAYYYSGNKYNNNSSAAYGASYTNSDVIGVALDCDAGTLVFYKNGASQGTAYTGLTSGPYFPAMGNSGDTTTCVCNFGQRAFAYTAPSGFKALCTANLPSTTITTSGSYTGNGVADGPFVYLNGVPTAMTIGGNAVTFGTHADKLSNGFKIRTTSTTYNQNASIYSYSITTTGDAFKYARAQSN